MKPDEVFRRLPLDGAAGALAAEITRSTGRPGLDPDRPGLRASLSAAFPRLPPGASLEGCTDHPSLTLRWRIEGLGRENAKAVLTPCGGGLEVRLRIEMPGGSYRKETLARLAAALQSLEGALAADEPALGRGEEAAP